MWILWKKQQRKLYEKAIGRKGLKPKDSDLPLVYAIEYVKVYQ